MMRIAQMLAALSMLVLLATPARAAPEYCPQFDLPKVEAPLRIGTIFSPPFIMGSKSEPEGLSVDFWRLIASCLDLPDTGSQYVEFATVPELIAAVAAHQVDLSIAPVPITVANENLVDFSFTFFQASFGALVADRDRAANFQLLLARIFQSNILNIILGLVGFMVAVGTYYWWIERRNGNEFFGEGPLRGLYRSLIWAALLVFQGRSDPYALRSRFGQLIVLMLMFFGVTIISSFTAIITSNLTLQALEPEVGSIADLDGRIVAAINQSPAAKWAERNKLPLRQITTFPQAQRNLDEGEIDVFLSEREVLLYLINEGSLKNVRLSPMTIDPQTYAIAFPTGSPLREPVNLSLLTILADPIWHSKMVDYFGSN